MRPIPSRYSPWRVNHLLGASEQMLCAMYGMDGNDFVKLACAEYVFQLLKTWKNIETYSVAFDLKRNPSWTEWAYQCDDYKEFISIAAKNGVDETSAKVRLKDRKVLRLRMDKVIRSMRNEGRKKNEHRESFLLPHKLREKRSSEPASESD